MDTREEAIQRTVVRLQAIKTLDEYKEAKDEVLDLVEAVFKASLTMIENALVNVFSMEPDEKQKYIEEFQDESFPLSTDIAKELERLDSIPGGIDYFEAHMGPEFDRRIEPYMQQIGENLSKVMEALMGGLVEGMAQAFGGAGVQEEVVEEVYPEYNPDDPNSTQLLYSLYSARSVEELEPEKLLEDIKDEMQYAVSDLEILTDTSFMEIQEHDLPKIAQLKKEYENLIPELNKELDRLAALPDATEKVDRIRAEMISKLDPELSKILDYLKKTDELVKNM